MVLRARGPLLRASRDALVLGDGAVTVGASCGPAALRARRVRGGWRVSAGWPACAERTRVRLRARVSDDCTLARGVLRASRARSRFTAVVSRCGDGLLDAGAGEQCDDGNGESGDGCEAYCAPCDEGAPFFASTWAAIETRIFTRYRCTGCHGSAATGGLDLRPEVAYGNLIGVPSLAAPNLARVVPGDAAASLFWLLLVKGTGDPAFQSAPGIGMPLEGRIASDELEALARWIDAGAPESGVVAGTEPLLDPCPSPVR